MEEKDGIRLELDALLRYNNARLVEVSVSTSTITFEHKNSRGGVTDTKYCSFEPSDEMTTRLEKAIVNDWKMDILIKRFWNKEEQHLEFHLVEISRRIK